MVLKLPTLLEGEALAIWFELSEEEQANYKTAKRKQMLEKMNSTSRNCVPVECFRCSSKTLTSGIALRTCMYVLACWLVCGHLLQMRILTKIEHPRVP